MRVLKIIQTNPEVFNTDPTKNYTEQEAIRLIASLDPQGNSIQSNEIEIRQTHLAIQNLVSLGFIETAVNMAIDLIPKAQSSQNLLVIQDLCQLLISHYFKIDTPESVLNFKRLFDKVHSIVALEHETLLLCGRAILNQEKTPSTDLSKISVLLTSIKKKLHIDSTWYHYYYYQFRAILLNGEDLENLYLEAIDYFRKLHFKHGYFANIFLEKLIHYYLKLNNLEGVENILGTIEPGSIFWFKSYLTYTKELLNQKDLKANDTCTLTMNHSAFAELPHDLKEEWRSVYKATVKLLLNS